MMQIADLQPIGSYPRSRRLIQFRVASAPQQSQIIDRFSVNQGVRPRAQPHTGRTLVGGVRYFFGAGFEGRLFPWMTCRKPILTLRSLEVLSWAGALWPGASTVLCQAEEG